MRNTRTTALPTLLAAVLLSGVFLSTEGCRGGVKAIVAKFHHRKSHTRENTTDYADNVAQVVSTPRIDVLKNANFEDYQSQVQSFYEARNYELAWTREGKPTSEATAMIQLFTDAANKGLRPEDYDASRWPQLVQELKSYGSSSSDDAQTKVAQFDAAVTISSMRFLSDVHLGRINPQALNFDIDVPAKRAAFDLTDALDNQIVDSDDVPSAVAKLEPQNPMYKATEDALPKYLQLAQQQPAAPLPPAAKPISAGGQYADVAGLYARLQMEGDAAAGAMPQGYDQSLSEAVRHFQARNGLTEDGKLSQATIDAMNVPMATRVQQLSDSLERWRWLPDEYQQPRFLVNLPEFMVRTYDADNSLAFKMKVVDGESNGHDTPMFVRHMRYMIFRPYWNLPTSIVKKELLRHVNSSGAGYLERNNYEVVNNKGEAVSGWNADDLEHSRYLVRQKPGPKNSLGLVKFMFPNEYDIYMHSTPEMALFNLTRRDRSHGCVRLNDAEKMANWVLNGQGDWDADKIHEAMFGPADGGEANNNKQVNLPKPLPVVLTYLTANADEDGTVHFFKDMYGYDKQLENALAQPRPYSKDPVKINPKLTPGETE